MLGYLFVYLSMALMALAEEYSNPIRLGQGYEVNIPPISHLCMASLPIDSLAIRGGQIEGTDLSAYYFLTTPGNQLHITKAKTLNGLKTAEKVMVYQDQEMISKHTVWAPEIHKLGGKWYLYYTLADRSYVLSGGVNPLDNYTNPVLLYTEYGIDGTVLQYNNQAYYSWSCMRPLGTNGTPQQSICISKLLTPTSIDTANIGLISQPEEAWEQHGRPLNEGPMPLYWAGQTYLVYSGSFCESAQYSLGLLKLVGTDPLLKTSWKKLPGPAFTAANGEFSTGHNGIFISPDGTELWNVYHASKKPEGSCGTDRETFAMKVDTSKFDTVGPVFGVPQAPGPKYPGPSGEDGTAGSVNASMSAGPGQSSASQSLLVPVQSANVTSSLVANITIPAVASPSAPAVNGTSSTVVGPPPASSSCRRRFHPECMIGEY